MNIINNIKKFREEKGDKQIVAAALIGVSLRCFQELESANDHKKVGKIYNHMEELEKYFDKPIKEIIDVPNKITNNNCDQKGGMNGVIEKVETLNITVPADVINKLILSQEQMLVLLKKLFENGTQM